MARALSRLASFVQNPVNDINSPHACRRGSRAASSRSVRCREGTREEVSLHFSADSLLWTVSSASSGARERLSVRDAGRSGVSGHGISARFIRGRHLFPRSGRRSARSPAGGERPGCAPPGPRCCALSPPGVASRAGAPVPRSAASWHCPGRQRRSAPWDRLSATYITPSRRALRTSLAFSKWHCLVFLIDS